MTNAPDFAPALFDAKRVRALKDTALLDAPAEVAFDRLTRLASITIDVPSVVVNLVDDERQFFMSSIGMGEPWASMRCTPMTHSICQYVIEDTQPLIIDDLRESSRVAKSPAIPDLQVIAYAGIPLKTKEGFVLGSFCAVDSKPRKWSERDVSILTDLAAATMTEIELRMEKRVAEKANRAKTDFLHRVSHEFRTPLNSMLGFARILDAKPSGDLHPKDRQFVSHIHESGEHLLTLVNELLDLARTNDGAMPVANTSVELGAVVREVVALTSGSAKPGVELKAAVPDGLAPLTTDRPKLKQVLINLVGNALKYTDNGSVTLAVRASGGTPSRIEVVDTGTGIPAADMERVFQPFAQAKTARAGSGLGLAIARAFCDLMGYRLAVESTVGKGSTFIVHLGK